MADALKFTEDHLWLRVEGNRAQLGISEYGQAELGEVIAVDPAIVNEDPYHEGWLVEIKLQDEAELEDLMDADEYEEFASGEEEG